MNTRKAGPPAGRKMPEFRKPPPDLAADFAAALDAFPDAQRRNMFGSPAAFAAGQMFTGLFGSGWFVRLGDADLAELERLGAKPFEVMPGRPMKGYALLPGAVREDPAELRDWLRRSFEYATSLPPKKARR